jgi:hypothetical protein
VLRLEHELLFLATGDVAAGTLDPSRRPGLVVLQAVSRLCIYTGAVRLRSGSSNAVSKHACTSVVQQQLRAYEERTSGGDDNMRKAHVLNTTVYWGMTISYGRFREDCC